MLNLYLSSFVSPSKVIKTYRARFDRDFAEYICRVIETSAEDKPLPIILRSLADNVIWAAKYALEDKDKDNIADRFHTLQEVCGMGIDCCRDAEPTGGYSPREIYISRLDQLLTKEAEG